VTILSQAQLTQFDEQGFLVVPGFYEVDSEIIPIQREIHAVIDLVRRKHGLSSSRAFSPESFDQGWAELIRKDRRYGGEVYDALKQIPAFVRLVASAKHDAVLRQVRGTDLPGVAAGGYGIRIDNPGEELYRADWHQEYPAQLRSLDGITFWTSLVPVEKEMGPVSFCVGSHKQGMRQVLTHDPENKDKTGAYALVLKDRDAIVAGYEQAAPLTQPGDAVLIDFAVLHASGHNRGKRARWTSQVRYFNFRDPTGIRLSWCGSFAAGVDFRAIHPELVAPDGKK
jgi:hypothetical protein